MKKIKKFDYYSEARIVEKNDPYVNRRWDSCVFEAVENKLNEIIKTVNLLSEAKK